MPLPATMRRRQGFTLLEISIVVMIIGLIVGGVLAGEELLRGSELQRVIKERDKVFASVETFRIKYHALPGDLSNATDFWGVNANGCPNGNSPTGTCNGNSNGIIEWVNSATQSESFRFWQHLGLSGMFPGRFTGAVVPTTYYVPGTNVPYMANGGFWIILYSLPDNPATFKISGNALMAGGTGTGYAVFIPEDAKRIDQKADDGMPSTGKISVGTSAGTPNCTESDTIGTDYKLTVKDQTCTLYFWMNQ